MSINTSKVKEIERNKLFFSIIMPVYNTPILHLKKAIKSIDFQNFNQYELILVDDGSDTECVKWIDLIREKNNKVSVIHKKNGGVSSARNAGIIASIGKYIIFVDSDDLISENFLEEAAHYIKKYMPDIIFGTIDFVPNQYVVQNNGCMEIFNKNDLVDVKKSLLNIQPRKLEYNILGTPCARIYKAEHVKKILFREGVPLCEDQLFNREILEIVDKVLVVPNIWYFYLQNDFSAMHNTMKKNYFNMAKPYWDVLVSLNKKEGLEIRTAMSIKALGLYYTVIQKDYLHKNLEISKKIFDISVIAQHPLILDSLNFLETNSCKLLPNQKIGFFLLKHKLFLGIYLAQYIKYR